MFDTEVVVPADSGCPEFDPGPGPRWSSYVPDGLLADMLVRESGEGSQWEQLKRIGAWERVVRGHCCIKAKSVLSMIQGNNRGA